MARADDPGEKVMENKAGGEKNKAAKAAKKAARKAAKKAEKAAAKAGKQPSAAASAPEVNAMPTPVDTATGKAKAKGASKAKAKPSRPKEKRRRGRHDVFDADPDLFAPLTQGEVADALRILSEDRRLTAMTKVGRYRVIAAEPLVVKPPQWMAGHRLARIVIYDYAADRCADACIDLDLSTVAHLNITRAQPMLAREEEALAISLAMRDEGVKSRLGFGDEAQVAMHYWSRRERELPYNRRSAAVIFGRPGSHPSLIAVVDLLDNVVTDIVPAGQW